MPGALAGSIAAVPRTVVHIPGWGVDADYLSDVLPHVGAPDQRVADLRGCRTRAEMVARVLEDLPPGSALAGVSMGGWVAQAVAAAAPERVARLLLVSTWGTAPPTFVGYLRESEAVLATGTLGEDVRAQVALNFAPERRDGPLPDRLVAALERLGAGEVLAQARAMLAEPDAVPAASVRAATLVVAGGLDTTFAPSAQRALALSLAAAGHATVGFEVVPGCAHNVPLEAPEAYAEAVRRWCVDPRPRGIDPAPA